MHELQARCLFILLHVHDHLEQMVDLRIRLGINTKEFEKNEKETDLVALRKDANRLSTQLCQHSHETQAYTARPAPFMKQRSLVVRPIDVADDLNFVTVDEEKGYDGYCIC